jgi:DNA repair exonuclease SbcCD nuclease subunit
MKIVCTSDWHLDAVTLGVRRFPELKSAVGKSVDAAIAAKADAYVFVGDLCDPDSGPCVFRCLELAQRTALTLLDNGIKSYWVAGNHDVIEDGSGDTTLTPLFAMPLGIDVFDRPGSADPCLGDVMFTFLPYTATSHAYDPESALVKHVGALPVEGLKHVVFSHLSVPGIVPGEETTEMPRGREVTLPVEFFKGRDDIVVIQGHYHRRQKFSRGGVDVHVVGSLARLTFGEQEHEPGYLIVEC